MSFIVKLAAKLPDASQMQSSRSLRTDFDNSCISREFVKFSIFLREEESVFIKILKTTDLGRLFS